MQAKQPIAIAAILFSSAVYPAPEEGVLLTHLPEQGKVVVTIDGQLFTQYVYTGYSRPFLYPILGPDQIPMTRNWPIRETEGEEHDHPHHKSLWWAHGEVNGIDFWSEGPKAGKTVHETFLKLCSGQSEGVIQSRNKLIDPNGQHIGTVEFDIHFYRVPDVRILDFNVTINADQGDLLFQDTKEGTMAIRVAESMRVQPNSYYKGKSQGHIVNSEGVRDAACWGKRAKWVDYYGPVQGQIMGIAIFDHPSNPRHPTWWHVRDYGLFAANPFGVHYFERQPQGTGDLLIEKGRSLTFRYRFVFHRGDDKEGRIAERYEQYCKTTQLP